jgi:hypothetical protein
MSVTMATIPDMAPIRYSGARTGELYAVTNVILRAAAAPDVEKYAA